MHSIASRLRRTTGTLEVVIVECGLGRGSDQCCTLTGIAGRLGVGNMLIGDLQTRQHWVEGWCCQVALDFLVQRQQVPIGFHLVGPQAMIQLLLFSSTRLVPQRHYAQALRLLVRASFRSFSARS
jgi:hypothetical protein